MKVYSVSLKSTNGSNKRALYTCVKAKDLQEAVNKAIAETSAAFGDQGWKVELKNAVDIMMLPSEVLPPMHPGFTATVKDEDKIDRNVVLGWIINFMDKKLFNAAKKYLKPTEIQLCEERLSKKNYKHYANKT